MKLTPKNKERIISLATWICRLLVGATFIFSGFVKAVDPWGTLYKVKDYLGVLQIDLWPNLVLVGVFALCALEFLTGVFVLLGCFRRSIPWVVAAIMLFMTPLTLWIAIANPVADCGCFGDAWVISNWATFWKNVALCIMTVWLIRFNARVRCIVAPWLQWLCFVASGAFIAVIALTGYLYQPLLDFRPYKLGMPIVDVTADTGDASPDDSYDETADLVFVYEKDGVKKEFTADDELPDESDGWVFVERKMRSDDLGPSDGNAGAGNYGQSDLKDKSDSSASDFRIWSEDGTRDVTSEVASPEGKRIFLMMPDLAHVSTAVSWQINSLYTWAQNQDIDMIAVVSGDEGDIAAWKDRSLASYPVYTADDTAIKEVVRGNPAVVYTEDGKIVWKSSLRALDTDDFLADGTSTDPRSFAIDNPRLLRNYTGLYLVVLAVLVAISFSPKLTRLFFPKKRVHQNS